MLKKSLERGEYTCNDLRYTHRKPGAYGKECERFGVRAKETLKFIASVSTMDFLQIDPQDTSGNNEINNYNLIMFEYLRYLFKNSNTNLNQGDTASDFDDALKAVEFTLFGIGKKSHVNNQYESCDVQYVHKVSNPNVEKPNLNVFEFYKVYEFINEDKISYKKSKEEYYENRTDKKQIFIPVTCGNIDNGLYLGHVDGNSHYSFYDYLQDFNFKLIPVIKYSKRITKFLELDVMNSAAKEIHKRYWSLGKFAYVNAFYKINEEHRREIEKVFNIASKLELEENRVPYLDDNKLKPYRLNTIKSLKNFEKCILLGHTSDMFDNICNKTENGTYMVDGILIQPYSLSMIDKIGYKPESIKVQARVWIEEKQIIVLGNSGIFFEQIREVCNELNYTALYKYSEREKANPTKKMIYFKSLDDLVREISGTVTSSNLDISDKSEAVM